MKQRDLDRFWKKVDKTSNPNGCWEWCGAIVLNRGYGLFGFKGTKLAHRISYELSNGSIPSNMCVCHTCDNPKCVNPQHLWLGTTQDNTEDRHIKNRSARGSKIGTSKLTEAQVKDIKSKQLRSLEYCKKYNISDTTVYRIWNNEFWKHI
jgi:hypothetical protein